MLEFGPWPTTASLGSVGHESLLNRVDGKVSAPFAPLPHVVHCIEAEVRQGRTGRKYKVPVRDAVARSYWSQLVRLQESF